MYVGSISLKAKETPKAGQDDAIEAVYALVRERSDALGDISPPICAALSPRPTGLWYQYAHISPPHLHKLQNSGQEKRGGTYFFILLIFKKFIGDRGVSLKSPCVGRFVLLPASPISPIFRTALMC